MNFYDEAIQAKHDLQLELVRRQRALKKIAEMKSVRELDTRSLCLNTIYSNDLIATEEADPYFWNPRIAQLVLATGQQLPETVTYNASWLRGKAGYWWFGRSSPLVGVSRDNERKYVSSLLWRLNPNGSLALQTFYLEGRTECSLGAFTWDEGESLADALRSLNETHADVIKVPDLMIREMALRLAEQTVPLARRIVEVKKEAQQLQAEIDELSEKIGDPARGLRSHRKYDKLLNSDLSMEEVEKERVRQFGEDYQQRLDEWTEASRNALVTFACGCLWLQQKIITVSQAPLTRAAERRLARDRIDPKCLVVELRSKQYTHTTADEEKHLVDWAWQWAVRGHWRDQPTKEGSKLIWIHPYIKGPEDKPLKPDAGRVFAVTR